MALDEAHTTRHRIVYPGPTSTIDQTADVLRRMVESFEQARTQMYGVMRSRLKHRKVEH